MNIGVQILLIFLLILINGFFAMSETAVFASRRARLQHRANEGDEKSRKALELAVSPNRMLSTVQVGITLIGVLNGAVGGALLGDILADAFEKIPWLAPYAHTASLTLVVLLITYFSIVVGELVPKRLALQNAEKIAANIAGLMSFIAVLFKPAVWLLSHSSELILRLLGVKPSKDPIVTEEEILVQLDQGTQAGVFEEAEQDMVEGVFSLSDQRVGSLMTPRNDIVWLNVTDTPAEIRRKIAASAYSRFPVCEDSLDQILGVVKAKDVLLADLKTGMQLKQIVKPPTFIPETAMGSRALDMFKEGTSELMLVTDEFGVVQGLVTIFDLIEEIVGEVGQEEPQATQRQDGSWLLDGMLPVDEFKEIFNLRKLPDEQEYETLGGFVLTHLGRIPHAADQFEWNGFCVEVMDMDDQRVDKVLVTTLPVRTVLPIKGQPSVNKKPPRSKK